MLQQKEDIALLFARLFIASMFLPSGLEKLFNFPKFSASLASKGLPYSEVWAVLTAAIEVLGPIALIVGAWSQWTAVALDLAVFQLHLPSAREVAHRRLTGGVSAKPWHPQHVRDRRVQDDRTAVFKEGKGLLHCKEQPLHVHVEGRSKGPQ